MWRRQTGRLMAGVLAAMALALAGCGGDDDATTEATGGDEATVAGADEYRQEILDVLTPLSTELQQIGAETADQQSLDQVATNLGQAQDVVRGAIDDLEQIAPPAEFEAPQDRLIGALEEFERATADAQQAAESGDAQAIVDEYPAAASELQQELSAVVQDYEQAGLEVQAPTSP
jgi:hypothetical protein